MTVQELLQILRTMSAMESAYLVSNAKFPDYLSDDVQRAIESLEREILKQTAG